MTSHLVVVGTADKKESSYSVSMSSQWPGQTHPQPPFLLSLLKAGTQVSLSLSCGYLALRGSNHSSPSPDPTQAWLIPGLCNLCVNLGVSWMCHPLGPFLSSSVTLPNLHNVSTRQRGTAVHPWSQNPTISQKLALLHGPSSTNYLKKHKKTFLPPAKSRAMLFPAHQ